MLIDFILRNVSTEVLTDEECRALYGIMHNISPSDFRHFIHHCKKKYTPTHILYYNLCTIRKQFDRNRTYHKVQTILLVLATGLLLFSLYTSHPKQVRL